MRKLVVLALFVVALGCFFAAGTAYAGDCCSKDKCVKCKQDTCTTCKTKCAGGCGKHGH